MKLPKPTLFVRATPLANVHELSPEGDFITGHNQPRRTVGKLFNPATKSWDIVEGGVWVHYHPEYIKHLKEGSLVPANLDTAIAAGVSWIATV